MGFNSGLKGLNYQGGPRICLSALKICVADGWFSGKAVIFLVALTTLRSRGEKYVYYDN
jgi:hypothetical protein